MKKPCITQNESALLSNPDSGFAPFIRLELATKKMQRDYYRKHGLIKYLLAMYKANNT